MIVNLIIRFFVAAFVLIRWLVFNRLGIVLLLAAGFGSLILVNINESEKVYTASKDWLIKELGLSWVFAVLFLIATTITLRFRPRFLLRNWYRLIGLLTLYIPINVILAQFNANLGSKGLANLGGDLGQQLAGPTFFSATVTTTLGMFVSLWLLSPRQVNWVIRISSRITTRIIGSAGKTTIRMYKRTRPDKYLLWVVIASVIMIAQAILRLAMRIKDTASADPHYSLNKAAVPISKKYPTEDQPVQLDFLQNKNTLVSPEQSSANTLQEAKETTARMIVDLDKRAVDALSETNSGMQIQEPTLSLDETTPEFDPQVAPVVDIVDSMGENLHEPVFHQPKNTVGSATLQWDLPSMGLLLESTYTEIDNQGNREKAQLIEETLAEYGIEVQIRQIWPGPTVTIGLAPGWVRRSGTVRQKNEDSNDATQTAERKTRVKVDSILAREKDLALALAAPSIRFEAPVPGESVVGIEVPNQKPSLVALRSAMENPDFETVASKSPLAIALGTGAGGQPIVIDLAKMPHLLISGSTGSGKSVCLNSIISGMLLRASPMDLRMLLVDPKRVELTPFNGIPHLLTPVIVESDRVVSYLKGMLREMDRRYRAMESLGVRNIEGYNAAVAPNEKMPYLLLGIDELADLMMNSAYDVEHTLCRLAQLGRATGIHLIVATQRPSVDVVTGLIKANFPSRISFNVTSQIDSRTILDGAGAEKLLGRGDMLFLPPDAPKPRRVQGTFISDGEIEEIVRFWSTQKGPAIPEIDLSDPQSEEGEFSNDQLDAMFERAVQMASSNRQLSTSLLQRRLRIGYPRAARLREQLESEGIISPSGEVIMS